MKKSIRTAVSILLVAVMLTALCTGCGGNPFSREDKQNEDKAGNTVDTLLQSCRERDISVAVAVLAGVREGNYDSVLSDTHLDDILCQLAYSGGAACFINVDGDPSVYAQPEVNVSTTERGLPGVQREPKAKSRLSELKGMLYQAVPDSAEANLFDAFITGAEFLQGRSEGVKLLVVADNCIATKSYVDMTQIGLDAEPNEVISALKKENALPSLAGVSVVCVNCGVPADPQGIPSEKQKKNIRSLWEGIFTECGAECVAFYEAASGAPYTEMPSVTAVPVDERVITWVDTITLSDSMVTFKGDLAVYKDSAAAETVLRDVAATILANPKHQFYVVGCTASGEDTFCQKLSQARAETVVSSLMRLGVPDEQLTPVGLSFHNHWYQNDRGADGLQIDSIAAQNRSVRIIDKAGDDAQFVMN